MSSLGLELNKYGVPFRQVLGLEYGCGLDLSRLSPSDFIEDVNHQIVIEGGRMVEVVVFDIGALLLSETLVEAVHRNDSHLLGLESLDDLQIEELRN